MSNRPAISAPTLASRSEISSSPRSPAPPRIRLRVSDAAPDLSGASRLAPAGKSTARSSIGRSWVSTNNTRAPLVVCHCWMGKVAFAADTAARHAANNISCARRVSTLVTADSFRVRTRALAAGQWLRIKHRNGQVVVDEIFSRDLTHLVGGHFPQFPHLQIRRIVRQADGLQHADVQSLVVDRVTRIDLGGRNLRLDPLQFVVADAVLHQHPDLIP